jgi:hypothetical protein
VSPIEPGVRNQCVHNCSLHFAELLDYDAQTKAEKMITQGWSTDTSGYFDDNLMNRGWMKRRSMFLESSKALTEVFSESPVPLMGALISDFQSFKNGNRFLSLAL